MEVFIILIIDAIICAILGAIVASNKNAIGGGFILGLLFGPLGVIVAFTLDNRPKCPKCLSRLERNAEICCHCQTKLVWLVIDSDLIPFTPEKAEERRSKQKIEQLQRPSNDKIQICFRNYYKCSSCGEKWEDEWGDDECPSCGIKATSPYRSEDLA